MVGILLLIICLLKLVKMFSRVFICCGFNWVVYWWIVLCMVVISCWFRWWLVVVKESFFWWWLVVLVCCLMYWCLRRILIWCEIVLCEIWCWCVIFINNSGWGFWFILCMIKKVLKVRCCVVSSEFKWVFR